MVRRPHNWDRRHKRSHRTDQKFSSPRQMLEVFHKRQIFQNQTCEPKSSRWLYFRKLVGSSESNHTQIYFFTNTLKLFCLHWLYFARKLKNFVITSQCVDVGTDSLVFKFFKVGGEPSGYPISRWKSDSLWRASSPGFKNRQASEPWAANAGVGAMAVTWAANLPAIYFHVNNGGNPIPVGFPPLYQMHEC